MNGATIIAIGAAGGLLAWRAGAFGAARGPGLVQVPSSAGSAAVGALGSEVLGVPYTKPANGSPIDTLAAQTRALIAARGRLDDGKPLATLGYPARLTVGECRAWIDLWLGAYQAGAKSSADGAFDFSLVKGDMGVIASPIYYASAERGASIPPPWPDAGEVNHNTWNLTDLGRAVVSVLWWRRTGLGGGDSSVAAIVIQETRDRLLKLAAEIEGVGYAFPGATPSQAYDATHDYGGALEHAAGESVRSIGRGAEAIVAAAASSPILWVVGLGLVAWKVLGR